MAVEQLIKRLEAQVRAIHLLRKLVAHHGRRMSMTQRWFRIASSEDNQLWMAHCIRLGDDAFRQCGRWSNELRRVRAFSVLDGR